MKKIIRWLAKVFNANIDKVEIKYIEKEVIKYIQRDDILQGNITVKGNLIVEGYIYVTGDITCREIKK